MNGQLTRTTNFQSIRQTMVSKDDTDRNVGGSEEELSVEVGLLYGVHVCHDDLTLPSCQSNHGKVFQQLTANGTCAHLG